MKTQSTIADCFSPRARICQRIAHWLGVALLAVGLEPGAAQVQQPTSQPPEKHYQAARAAVADGNMDRADLEVKLALQDNPLDAASHFLLGCLLERKGENDQAIVGFQRALSLDPTNPEALYNLGTMLLRRGEAVPASRLLENAVMARSDHVASYNNLAKAYFMAGLPELAVAAYEEALRRNPSSPIALKNLMLLAEASGIPGAAASYQRRLEAVEPGRAGKPVIDSAEPAATIPTWPLADGAAVSSPPAPLPGIHALEPQAPPGDSEADGMRELLRDLPHVAVERRGGRLTLIGWTSGPREKEMLGRILAEMPDVLNLTTDDVGDAQRMIEVDAIIFVLLRVDQTTVGFNFLRLVQTNFTYFASDHARDLAGLAAPGTIGEVVSLAQNGWLFVAAVDYNVNIANAVRERVAVLARPHLTTLSGTPARFLVGGEIVFKVSGLNSGDIKPYPFGTTLVVTPTLLRTPGEDGSPRVHVAVDAGRTSVLALLDITTNQENQVAFDKINVTSQAVVGLGQTLILSGLSQRESRSGRAGVPGLMYVPILKYLFSTKSTVETDSAVIVLLTPRDPAFMDERNRTELERFVEKRRAFLQAKQGTPEDMRRYQERYPDWDKIAPNRFASHFFLTKNSELYRTVSAEDLSSETLDLDLLGKKAKKKSTTQ
jgi:Tfp pilus assembly protein PilF